MKIVAKVLRSTAQWLCEVRPLIHALRDRWPKHERDGPTQSHILNFLMDDGVDRRSGSKKFPINAVFEIINNGGESKATLPQD